MAKKLVRVRRRKKKRRIRRWIVFLFVLSLLIGGGFYYVNKVYTASYEDLDRGEKSDLRDEAVDIGDDPISLLLMGVEDYSTDGGAGRADTQIVMTLDPDTKEITMTSIPRDTQVDIPAYKVGDQYAGTHKLNAAYSLGEVSGYGAEKLTIETVEDYLGIPIDKFASVNFEGFMEIVDLMGGVTIDVKEGFWERSSLDYDKKIEFEAGETTMNGEEALAFVRMRKRDVAVSYPRDERQRQFIRAGIDEALSADNLLKAGEFADILGDSVSTNLTISELYAIQKTLSSENPSTTTYTIEGQDMRLEDGLYYFVPDDGALQETKQKLQQALDITPSGSYGNTSSDPNE
ncbi:MULTISPECIES: LCP family protein [Halobacillus]|uniref:LCP family protein n=1 Tax=Halobacillus TaxID=45667 RepID=UPI00136E683B|nr:MULTISPECIES: LCP family protein [Halobacillus]MYL30969.1 LytR family transcriptional regulator [Halobacillus halophilus]MYL36230.1 LytR family transcriptional regulator [Halobacillus litoralis]